MNAEAGATSHLSGEELLAMADGGAPPAAASTHVGACKRCREVLGALVGVDLDGVWAGVDAAVARARPTVLERLTLRVGIDPALARFAAATPTLGLAWLLASVTVIALGVGLEEAAGGPGSAAALVVAPLVAAALVAFAYGPAVDPAYEVVATTPMSPVRALLTRLAVVLTVNALLVGLIDLAIGRDGLSAGWLLPMAAVALLAAVVAARSAPVVGAVAGAGAWLAVLAVAQARGLRPEVVSTTWVQLAFAAAAALLLTVLVRATGRGGWWASHLPAG